MIFECLVALVRFVVSYISVPKTSLHCFIYPLEHLSLRNRKISLLETTFASALGIFSKTGLTTVTVFIKMSRRKCIPIRFCGCLRSRKCRNFFKKKERKLSPKLYIHSIGYFRYFTSGVKRLREKFYHHPLRKFHSVTC